MCQLSGAKVSCALPRSTIPVSSATSANASSCSSPLQRTLNSSHLRASSPPSYHNPSRPARLKIAPWFRGAVGFPSKHPKCVQQPCQVAHSFFRINYLHKASASGSSSTTRPLTYPLGDKQTHAYIIFCRKGSSPVSELTACSDCGPRNGEGRAGFGALVTEQEPPALRLYS